MGKAGVNDDGMMQGVSEARASLSRFCSPSPSLSARPPAGRASSLLPSLPPRPCMRRVGPAGHLACSACGSVPPHGGSDAGGLTLLQCVLCLQENDGRAAGVAPICNGCFEAHWHDHRE